MHLSLGQSLHIACEWYAISLADIFLCSVTFKGEKVRNYTCCSRPADGEGCSHGPHVFYDSKAEELHSRHPFSFLRESDGNGKLDVVALDCEMIYTTGGMRVARVSVVDGSGKQILDELIRMDEGVHVMLVALLLYPYLYSPVPQRLQYPIFWNKQRKSCNSCSHPGRCSGYPGLSH